MQGATGGLSTRALATSHKATLADKPPVPPTSDSTHQIIVVRALVQKTSGDMRSVKEATRQLDQLPPALTQILDEIEPSGRGVILTMGKVHAQCQRDRARRSQPNERLTATGIRE